MDTKRILIVEDEEGVRITLAANLELEGYEVSEASNGAAALDRVAAEEFDLVLSDIRMPQMSGVDLAAALREMKPDLPVVLMTAFTDEDDIDEAIDHGVFTVLAKPFDVENIVSILSRAMRRPAILVVDDVEAEAQGIVETLRVLGLSARAAGGAEAALEALEAGEVDVCLVDLHMPGMSGVDLSRRIRSASRQISVIVFTGRELPEMVREASALGVFRCLKKPLNPSSLIQTIARARAVPSEVEPEG